MPSIVPEVFDREVYLVLDDLGGRIGRSWRETDESGTDRATLIEDLLDGLYSAPVRIVAFNTFQGWSRDVTDEIASELRDHSDSAEIPEALREFIVAHASSN